VRQAQRMASDTVQTEPQKERVATATTAKGLRTAQTHAYTAL
jgi:hypothetical protein